MFRVVALSDPNGENYLVYSVAHDECKGMRFLIYNGRDWEWVWAVNYKPYEPELHG